MHAGFLGAGPQSDVQLGKATGRTRLTLNSFSAPGLGTIAILANAVLGPIGRIIRYVQSNVSLALTRTVAAERSRNGRADRAIPFLHITWYDTSDLLSCTEISQCIYILDVAKPQGAQSYGQLTQCLAGGDGYEELS